MGGYIGNTYPAASIKSTAEGRALLEDNDVQAQRDLLGLGTAAVEDADVDATADTVVVRSNTGTIKGAPATEAGELVEYEQFQEAKVTLGTAVAASGTAIDFVGIPSWAKKITVMFNGVSTNGTSFPLVQVGDGSGFLVSGYFSASGYSSGSGANGGATSTAGFIIFSDLTGATLSGVMGMHKTGESSITSTHACAYVSSTANFGGGAVGLSGELDRIRITTVNGTDLFDAGTINISWEG